jgi:hypothetical protein
MIQVIIWLAALLCPNSNQTGTQVGSQTSYTVTTSSNPSTGGTNGSNTPPPPPPPTGTGQ